MSSVLSYRFNSSSKVWLQFPFEGGSITPNEFKRAVMKKLIPNAPSDKDTPGEQAGNVLQDFELQVFNDQTGEEYYGDMMSIPKNTQLVVKRVPNYRTKTLRLEAGGKQAAQDALEGYGTNTGVRLSSSAFDLPPSKRLNFGPGASVDEFGEDPLDESTYLQREEERRAQVAKERAAQLAAAIATATAKAAEAAQALATTPNAPTPSTMHAPMVAPGVRPPPSRPPPPGYICHNCRQGGHWKQLCPTAAHLSAPKVSMPLVQQATTGNVLSLLGLATRAPGAAAAILSAYTNRGVTNPSVTVAPNGSVIVTPSTAPVVAPLPAPPQPPQPTIPSDLTCTICHRLFTQPMVVPCCFTSFCEECIKQALVMDPSCPRCRSTDVSADQLRKNNVLARRAEQERSKLNQSQSIPQPLPQQPAMSHAAHYPPPQKMATFDGDDYSVQRR